MGSEKTTEDTITTAPAKDAPALVKKIGRTTYIVRVYFSKTSKETMSDKIKRMLKMRYGRCEKTITARSRDSEIRWLPACKIRRFMIVWRYENERESRWED